MDESDSTPKLVVVNRAQPDAIQRLLEKGFGSEVQVEEADVPEAGEDTVVLVDGGEIVASSSLQSVMDSFLLINSDTFRTSARGINSYELPDVLANLDEVVLELRGYPATNKEKLLLVAISRYIEGMALRADGGRLDASFQHIGRLDDEYGTRRVYDMLDDSDTEVHIYGVSGGKWVREQELDATVHTGDSAEYRKSWLVVYTPDDLSAGHAAALVCCEVGENVWRSTWTFDPERASVVQAYIDENF